MAPCAGNFALLRETLMEYLNIGSAPYAEDCAQVGRPDYDTQAKRECQAFIRQIERAFPPPESAYLKVKGFPHDFGRYYEVVCCYSNDTGLDYAYLVEAQAPEFWDDEARKELGL